MEQLKAYPCALNCKEDNDIEQFKNYINTLNIKPSKYDNDAIDAICNVSIIKQESLYSLTTDFLKIPKRIIGPYEIFTYVIDKYIGIISLRCKNEESLVTLMNIATIILDNNPDGKYTVPLPIRILFEEEEYYLDKSNYRNFKYAI